MKKIAFVGGYDKTDMILYIAKIISLLGKKVLIVDATVSQKAKYIIPTLTPTMTYITTNDQVDFAIGFDGMDTLKAYLADEGNMEYDYLLFDVDSRKRYRRFEIMPEDLHYLVTSFDIYSLRKAVEVLKGIEMKTPIMKIYFTKAITEEKDRYLRFITKDCNISYKKESLVFPTDLNDIESIQKNQRDNIIRYKSLSSKYLGNIIYMASEITGESAGNVKRVLRDLNR